MLALIGGGALLLLIAVVLILGFFATPKTSLPAALRAALAEKLNALHGNRYTITSYTIADLNPGKPDGISRHDATLAVRLADTLYAPVPAVDYIQNQMRLDTSAERKIAQILSGPGGARIRELAGLDATADTLSATQLVRETARAGDRYEFHATLTARRDTAASPATGGWRIDPFALTPQTPLPEGEPLAHFSGRRLLDITRESDLAALRRLVAQSNDALRRVEQARDRYRAELAADTNRATAAYLALLAPRTLFTGTTLFATPGRAVSPKPPQMSRNARGGFGETALPSQPIAISLEIETLDRPAARITALLRTDNSWNDARRLEGHCAYDLAANAFTLTLAAPAGPALTGANGLILNNGAAFNITLRLSPDARLTGGPPRGWTCQLARVPDASRDATIATLNATARKLLDATRPGAVYRVRVSSSGAANSQIPAEMLLRITAQNPVTHAIDAALEDTASDWTRNLRGVADDNIFRAAGHPIRLMSGATGSSGTGDSPVGLRDMGDPPMQNVTPQASPLKITGDPPVPLDPASATPPITLNLRFSPTDARALEGTLQAPASAPLAITLAPAGEQYLAQVAAQKTKILRNAAEQARLDHLATHPDLDTLPPAGGAYLWRSGLWLPLPRNNARVARSTLQKIGGLWSAALSLVKTRTDKQDTGTLTFDGAAAPPVAFTAAAGQIIILAYRGPMKIYAGADVPQNRIPIEIAPLEITNNGRRRAAELTRLGDSAATFGSNAIDATVEHPATTDATDIYLVRITRALPPGRYALAAPDHPFEFEVR